ncbi:dihydrofolate reductase family protein [Deinococcus koreensis]|uniref:Riboflavin biosynthesis protein RibD n=1 Tax=Deinococcus koreensis TaxID=2054903 RepID=A0A2K3V279_9DEIO|nr:dihydrofolate reductase family protein [Deinococcus koreensis]PNY82888.1 riboflavin biosynthesis protein RibD [Deinococcus koreensis]
MAKVVFGMTMSLDGFIDDANGSGALLSPNLEALDATGLMREAIDETGAVVMGRRTFEGASDPDSYADSYEFQVPIFVVTTHAPERKPKGNSRLHFTFVNSVEAAVEQARQAAGERDVVVVGGPNVGWQVLKAGLVDELQIGIMPVLLGQGQHLFAHLESTQIMLTKTRLVEAGQCTYIYFSVQK